MLFLICSGILAVYGLFILIAIIGWLLPNSTPGNWKLKDKATLIVPFRNEEANLPQLISSINQQSQKANVIFIDDNSTDASISKISLMEHQVLLNLGEGKKDATATGINAASGSLLLFTDADCALNKDHVKNYSENFAYTNFDFAYGPVLNSKKQNSFLQSVFYLDQLSLTAVSLGTGKMNMHLFCWGANMAGKKQILVQAAPNLLQSKNMSGDDMDILNFCKEEEKKIVALTNKNFIVTTNSPTTLVQFFRQRLRWGQKTGIKSNFLLLLLSLSVFLSTGLVIFSLIASMSDFWNEPWYLLPLLKLLIDLLLLFLVSAKLKVLGSLWMFIPAWIFNMIYIPIIAIIGIFYSGNWKDRKTRKLNFGE